MANVFDQFDAAGGGNPFDAFDNLPAVAQPEADPYRDAAIAERDALKARGVDTSAGYTRRLIQGRTFGLADEAVAAMMTPLEMIRRGTFNPAEGYRYAKARENLILDDARQRTGLPGAAAEVLGGIATGGMLSRAGILPTANLAPTASLGAKIGIGAAEGAGLGGVYGAAEGEGLQGRLAEGARGAAFGGVAGGVLPVISQGVASGWRAFQNSRAANEVAKQTGVSPEVMRMMGNAIDADGTLGPAGAANMARAGSEAMLADAGPNAKTILDTAIQRGGPGAVQARDAIAARANRGANDLTSALDDALGRPEGVTASQTAIRQGSAGARGNAYDAAYASPIDYASPAGRTLENLITSRVPASAIRDANALMRLEGHSSKQIMARLGDNGSVTFEVMPDVRQIDYLTRALNQAAQSGEGAGLLGGQTPLGRAYQNLSGEIRDTLRGHVPAYDNALKVAADPIRRSQAVEFGSKLLSPSTTRDAAAEAVRGMTDAERIAVAQGVRSNIDDAMARVTRTVMDGNTDAREAIKALKDLSSRANREKLAMVIGQDRADNLFREVDRVATSFDLRASVAQNSKTYAREATSQKVKQITQPGPVGKLAQGEPVNAARRLVQLLTGKTPEKIAAREDRIYGDMARLLTNPAQDAVPMFNGMVKLNNAEAANQMTANRIGSVLNSARPVILAPGVVGTLDMLRSARENDRRNLAARRMVFNSIVGANR